jgi:hypothetical protein
MHTKFQVENLKEGECLGGTAGRILLKWILKKWGIRVWTQFFWQAHMNKVMNF